MPEWARAAAVGRALRTRRNWIGGFGHVLWRRKVLILACLGLVLASTAAYVSALRPAYEAEALVASGNPRIGRPGGTGLRQIRYG